ncbi:miller-Dieker lissencephaly protein [Cytidiella melzeri]|nr:miller-Dieker lissencephaly protein [Cytidiella melzeri]
MSAAAITLTERQKDDLNKSILEYLQSNGHHNAVRALRADLGLPETMPDPTSPPRQLLERKWISVVRMQKKMSEMERTIATLQEELNSAPTRRAGSDTDWVPVAPAGYTLTGHREAVTKVAFHPTFSIIASASEDFTVKIWDWETGEFERTLKGHTRNVNDLDFDSKGNLLATASSDLFIKIWDTQNEWKNSKTFPGHEHTVSCVRFMPGDQQIMSASRDKTIRIFDVASTHLIRTIVGHSAWVRCAVPSDDGRLIVSCSGDHTARLIDPSTGETKIEFRGHDNAVEVVVFAPVYAYPAIRELAGLTNVDKHTRPGAYIATGGRDKVIKLWDTQNGQLIRTFAGHDNWVRALVFHPNGKFLLSASDDNSIRIWELKTARCFRTVDKPHGHFVTCLAWGRQRQGNAAEENGSTANGAKASADAQKVVYVVATGSVDQSIKIWMPNSRSR